MAAMTDVLPGALPSVILNPKSCHLPEVDLPAVASVCQRCLAPSRPALAGVRMALPCTASSQQSTENPNRDRGRSSHALTPLFFYGLSTF